MEGPCREFLEVSLVALAIGLIAILIYITIRYEFSFAIGAVVAGRISRGRVDFRIVRVGAWGLVAGLLLIALSGPGADRHDVGLSLVHGTFLLIEGHEQILFQPPVKEGTYPCGLYNLKNTAFAKCKERFPDCRYYPVF